MVLTLVFSKVLATKQTKKKRKQKQKPQKITPRGLLQNAMKAGSKQNEFGNFLLAGQRADQNL